MKVDLRSSEPGPDFLLLTMCKAAELIDSQADALCGSVADLLPSHPRYIAAFEIIDPLMRSWHALRTIVAQLPAKTPTAMVARTALLGADEACPGGKSGERDRCG
jgi:hypothetical protein